MLRHVLAVTILAGITTPALAGNFTVEFRNQTTMKVRVKTVRFSGTPPVTLNNGQGLDLSKSGQNGDKKSAVFSGDGIRAIIFWNATTGELLATSSENFDDDFNAFVVIQEHPNEPGKFLISVGAMN